MKNLGYHLLKLLMRVWLWCYFKKIIWNTSESEREEVPILLLPNHQNALLDALVIAVFSKRKPYFLTRSDVFTSPLLRSFFSFLRMLPIYRIRDGRDTLAKNEEIFNECASLLAKRQAILMFPEANHNLQRRVRPLSKGFTRILFRAQELHPNLDIYLQPIGINYVQAASFPDSAAFYHGSPIRVSEFASEQELRAKIIQLKNAIASSLKELTTHIEDISSYDLILERLNSMGVDFLFPKKVNSLVEDLPFGNLKTPIEVRFQWEGKVLDVFFEVLNFPLLLLWRKLVKPKVPEIEFMTTYRFLFAVLAYPLYYTIIGLATGILLGPAYGIGLVIAIFLYNLVYVKMR